MAVFLSVSIMKQTGKVAMDAHAYQERYKHIYHFSKYASSMCNHENNRTILHIRRVNSGYTNVFYTKEILYICIGWRVFFVPSKGLKIVTLGCQRGSFCHILTKWYVSRVANKQNVIITNNWFLSALCHYGRYSFLALTKKSLSWYLERIRMYLIPQERILAIFGSGF